MSTTTKHLLTLMSAALLLAACGEDDPKNNNRANNTTNNDTPTDMGADLPADMPDGQDLGEDQAAPADMADDMSVEPDMPDEPPVIGERITTDRGVVKGVRDGQTWAYRGIPYVAPPVGALRWRPPQAAAAWTGELDASAFGAKCPQKDDQGASVGAEDCLTINVWTPSKAAPAGGWPVMFFIHGGGNIQGSSSELLVGGKPIYDGGRLSGAQDVVVVTFNYRLGALGYLTTPQLDAETPASGNWGLLDQIEALKWTQRNIRAFGGDPDRVMIFGESAGAVNVCALLTAKGVDGLFHRALMESGACLSTPRAVAQSDAQALINDSSCKDAADKIACLRALRDDEILDELPASLEALTSTTLAGGLRTFGPTHGAGALLEVEPIAALEAGDFVKVPFVVGTNLDEMHNLLALPQNLTKAQYEQTVRAAFLPLGAGVSAEVLALYPADAYPTPREAAVQLYSDMRFTCPARQIARAARAHSDEVWRYFFTRRATSRQGETPASHAIELLYVFGSIFNIPLYIPDAPDAALSQTIQQYWGNLARSGVPDEGAEVRWPVYNPDTDSHIEFGTVVSPATELHTEKCDYFEELVASL